jgi:hypothetical protein
MPQMFEYCGKRFKRGTPECLTLTWYSPEAPFYARVCIDSLLRRVERGKQTVRRLITKTGVLKRFMTGFNDLRRDDQHRSTVVTSEFPGRARRQTGFSARSRAQ